MITENDDYGATIIIGLIVIIVVFALAISGDSHRSEVYENLKLPVVWETAEPNPYDRTEITILSKKEYWVEFQTKDGKTESLQWNYFYGRYKQKVPNE